MEKQAEDEQFFTKSLEEKKCRERNRKTKASSDQRAEKSAEIRTTTDDLSPRSSRFLPPLSTHEERSEPRKGRG
jgi:hypothetical protein